MGHPRSGFAAFPSRGRPPAARQSRFRSGCSAQAGPAVAAQPYADMQSTRRAAGRGFTLVEVMAVCAVAAVLAGVALPAYRGQLLRSGRGDAVEALTRVQLIQERFHAQQGVYADSLLRLPGAPQGLSAQGRYQLHLAAADGGYRVVARPVPGSPQAGDNDCPELTLDVRLGFSSIGPDARCWNR